jgi:hypothetical protein
MKQRTAILMAMVTLLLSGVTLQTIAPVMAQTGGPGPATWYSVEQEMASDGSYRLSSLALRQAQGDTWYVSGTVSSGDYKLTDAGQAGPWGNCCCTFLPLVIPQRPVRQPKTAGAGREIFRSPLL